MNNIIFLPLSLIVIGAMVYLVVSSRTKIHNGLKMLAILLLNIFGVMCWHSVNSILGWPTTQELPERFMIYAIRIDEPTKDNSGGIYFWVTDKSGKPPFRLFESVSYVGDPKELRSHKLPFSVEMQKELLKEGGPVDMIKKGNPVIGMRLPEGEENLGEFEFLTDPELINPKIPIVK